MAELVQMMNDWRRMCQFMDKEYGDSCCDNCPLGGCSAVYEMCGKENFTNMERDIMSWAAEHPEPVYPSWGEYLEKVIPHGSCETVISFAVYAMQQPIPADLAQKLEIEPKEGTC